MLIIDKRTKDSYVKFSGDIRPMKKIEGVKDIRQTWDKYMKEKYSINDQEMEELTRFLEL